MTHTPAIASAKSPRRKARTATSTLHGFGSEMELENYLVAHPSVLGQDLLIFGRQTTDAFGGRSDLLAITATGIIHGNELKLGCTSPKIVCQAAAYLYGFQRLNRAEIISIAAREPHSIDLEAAFLEQFNRPLPEVINQAQVLTIIAAAIDLRTQIAMMAIRHPGLSTTMFRYVVKDGAVSLLPCCFDGPDLEATRRVARQPALRPDHGAQRVTGFNVHIDESTRDFWLSRKFTMPLVLHKFIYELYLTWVGEQVVDGVKMDRLAVGLFSRQLRAIVNESREWDRVYTPAGSTMESLAALGTLPSMRAQLDAEHRIVGYLRNPLFR